MDLGLMDYMPQAKSNRGGRREGAGRKPGYSPDSAAKIDSGELDLDDENVSESTRTAVKKARAVASKEQALARHAWLKLRVDEGEYLPRSAFREAAATLLAELAQGLRSLPDILERKYNLAPDQVQLVSNTIDDSLNTMAERLELFTGADE